MSLVKAAREGRAESGGVDSFLHEYGLSSEEGVLLLCLAEALLRIPDAATADRLIAGTIGSGDWSRHLGHSDSLLVNASTWGLMLTGHILDWSERRQADLASMVQRLIARSGEPVIRQALRQAMRILGNQFVLGETIEEALANAEDEAEQGYRFSFDMLGEAARTEDDAERYALRYEEAAEAIAAWAGHPAVRSEDELIDRPGLSVKLSALHPRYQPSQEARLKAELVPRLVTLAQAMRDAWLPLTIDAEEAERLDLSLALMEPLFADPKLAEWNGLGLAVQAYSKRALPLIDWLAGCGGGDGPAHPGAAGQGRLLGQRDQMGAGGRARRVSRVHPQGEYRCRLSRRRASVAGAARLLLSAIRHPQRPHHRRHRHACGRSPLRVPAALRHGRGAAPRGRAAREPWQAVPHLCPGRRPSRSARLSRAPAVGERRQHLLRQPAGRRRSADRGDRRRSGREGGGFAREGQSV